MQDQHWQHLLVACRCQPSGGIEKADPVNVHLLTLRRLGHHQRRRGHAVLPCNIWTKNKWIVVTGLRVCSRHR